MTQDSLFELPPEPAKSYRAIRHDIVRSRQRENILSTNHVYEKQRQVDRVLVGKENLSIIELFCGDGFLTKALQNYGNVVSLDKKIGTGDSFLEYHRYIADRKKFDVVDADPYGFPSRLFPDIFLLIDDGILFLTVPIASVNIPNGITKTHLHCYYGNDMPSMDEISTKVVEYGLCHWRQVQEIDCVKMGRMWRVAYSVKKVKSTDYTGVRNR
jgi:hypothetical protein